MIKGGYYYPDWIQKNKLHKNEDTGEYEGTCVFCFIEGNRRAGKTVGVGLYCLDDYFKYGYKTAIIRRYIKDFEDSKKLAMENFQNKVQDIYIKIHPEHEKDKLTYSSHHAYINGKLFSYPIDINHYNDHKTKAFDNVHTLIYDEFVSEDGSRMPNEVSAIYNIYDTVARGRDDALKTTSVIFISNVITEASDFHIELNIDREMRADTKRLFRPEKGYCLEKVDNEAVVDKVNASPFAKLLNAGEEGKAYLGYSQANMQKDDNSFVDSKIKCIEYLYNFQIEGKIYAMKISNDGKYYMTDNGVQKNFPKTYACTKDDHTVNTFLITVANRNIFKTVKTAYSRGLLYFNSQRTKNAFMSIYRFL